ncbi:hypothetical protein [Luteibacter yeojuensis]|nr:hypothetical protein [Luteibacter yeojuensis]
MARTLSLAMAMAAPPAWASPPVLLPGGGHAMARLAHDANVHAEAFRKAVLLSDKVVPFNGSPVALRKSRKFMTALQRKVYSATVSTFDYIPNSGRATPLRIHARSGKSLDATLADIVRHQTPGDTSGSASEAGGRVSDNEVLADAGDARFYPPSADIRATNLQKKDAWVVEPSPEAGPADVSRVIHGTDAELKTLRQLEHEFERNPSLSEAGGTLTGYVSQEVCHSCMAAFEKFASAYKNIDITIYYLDTTAKPSQAALIDTVSDDIDIASKASSVLLRSVRRQTAEALLDPSVLAASDARAAAWSEVAWSDDATLERIAAAEAGSLGLSEACP